MRTKLSWIGLIENMRLMFSDGSSYKVAHQYLVGVHKNKYLKMDAKFVEDGEIIDATLSASCESCGTAFKERPTPAKFLSEDKELNHKIGRPGRVCIICYYRRYEEAGHVIPPPLREHF